MDFVVETPTAMVAIEVDGSQHFTPKGQRADRVREGNILKGGEAVSFIRLSWPVALKLSKEDLSLMLTGAERMRGSVMLFYENL